ncbi:glycosyltransferase family 4 protein [Jeotgalibaca sp. A122]|uniref:glycosyltransferase family 4 protein n=1 Tax=Jeotgalibaca sp. A122 TaxID=3457322 RepID=UPI003FD061FC
MKILYAVAWGKSKEKTWSGTGYSLYNALRKQVDVEDINVELNRMQKMVMCIEQLRLVNGKLRRNKYDFTKIQVTLKKNKLEKAVREKTEPLIQIGDFQTQYKNQYIYQDLSLDSLIDFRVHKPTAYKYSPFITNSIKNLLWRAKFQKKVYDNSKGIFTMSYWLRDHLIKYTKIPENKVHYVGAGINLDINKITNEKKTNNKILFVGRDFYRKGGDIVVKAFNELRKEMDNVELYIAGPKARPKEIIEMPEGIIFLGDLKFDKLSDYFNKCDIFCMPSRFEPFGLVYIEALVYGMPCIVSNDFAMKEVVKDGVNGYLLNNENIGELKEKMRDLLKNKTIKKNVLESREHYIQEYSWDTVATKMLRVIENDQLHT